MSYTTDFAGKRVVDTAELDRVFGISIRSDRNPSETDGFHSNGAGHAHAAKSNAAHERATALLPGEHAALQQLLADREACIADLRGPLDASETERRQLSERLHGLLTARTGKEKAVETTEFSAGEFETTAGQARANSYRV